MITLILGRLATVMLILDRLPTVTDTNPGPDNNANTNPPAVEDSWLTVTLPQ